MFGDSRRPPYSLLTNSATTPLLAGSSVTSVAVFSNSVNLHYDHKNVVKFDVIINQCGVFFVYTQQ